MSAALYVLLVLFGCVVGRVCMQEGFVCDAGSTKSTAALCPAGFECPTGTGNRTSRACPVGSYSFAGAAVCSPCLAGRFGQAPAMSSSLCTGPCAPGYFCADGSTNATAAECPPGSYCGVGAAVPQPCAAGFYGNASRLATVQCSGICPAGFYCPGEFLSTACGARYVIRASDWLRTQMTGQTPSATVHHAMVVGHLAPCCPVQFVLQSRCLHD